MIINWKIRGCIQLKFVNAIGRMVIAKKKIEAITNSVFG
jgi:hypothetical protein